MGQALYKIQPGDSLSKIANLLDITVDDLRDWNPDIKGDTIFAGAQLKLDTYALKIAADIPNVTFLDENEKTTAPAVFQQAAAEKPAADTTPITLSRDEKRNIQDKLTRLGFDTKGIDGIFGPNSKRAITAWKEKNGFDVNQPGIFTQAQLDRLNQDIAIHEQQQQLEQQQAQRQEVDNAVQTVIEETKSPTAAPKLTETFNNIVPMPKARPTARAKENIQTSWDASVGKYIPSDTALKTPPQADTPDSQPKIRNIETDDPRPGTLDIAAATALIEYEKGVASGEIEPQEPQKGRKRLTTRKKISDPSLPPQNDAQREAPTEAPAAPVKPQTPNLAP